VTQSNKLPGFDIAPDDPLLEYFQNSPSAVFINKLDLDSPALTESEKGKYQPDCTARQPGRVDWLAELGRAVERTGIFQR
jgi:hypothetical protein